MLKIVTFSNLEESFVERITIFLVMKTPPTSDSESSPSLNTRSSTTHKKPSLFSKLRQSIIPNEQHTRLKRTVSFDAGLQRRLNELGQVEASSNPIDALLDSIIEPATPEEILVTKSQIPSPTLPDEETTIYASIMTIPTSNFTISHSFQCAWLAPTRRLRLYQGELSIIPSTAIYFQASRLGKPVRLFIRFQDIFNVAEGSWNGARKQALIVDLTQAKKRNWLFVGWREGDLDVACREIVQEWNKNNLLKLREGIEKQKSRLSTKYHECCAADESLSLANPRPKHKARKSLIDQVCVFLQEKMIPKVVIIESKTPTPQLKSLSLSNVILEQKFEFVTPDILIQILTDQASGFMANLRAIQGQTVVSDSGWLQGERSFTLLTKLSDSKLSKWHVKQEITLKDPDYITLTCNYSQGKNRQVCILHEAKRIREANVDYKTMLTISSDTLDSEGTLLHYLKHDQIPVMASLLTALLEEAEFSFEADCSLEQEIPSETVRLKFVVIRTWLEKIDLYFTIAILPFLYHFSRQKWAKILAIAIVVIPLLLISCKMIYGMINAPLDPELTFASVLDDLVNEAFPLGRDIHNLKLQL